MARIYLAIYNSENFLAKSGHAVFLWLLKTPNKTPKLKSQFIFWVIKQITSKFKSF